MLRLWVNNKLNQNLINENFMFGDLYQTCDQIDLASKSQR